MVVSNPSEFTGLLEVELFFSCLYCQSIWLLPKSNISVDYNMLRFSVGNVIVRYGLRSYIKNGLIHWLSVGACNLFALR